MGKLEIVRSLFEYNEWANDRLVDAAYAGVHEKLRGLVDSLTEDGLDETMPVLNPQDGEWRTWERPAWQVALSFGSHAMQHRAEAAMILTELGHSPGQIDYSYFCWRAREQ